MCMSLAWVSSNAHEQPEWIKPYSHNAWILCGHQRISRSPNQRRGPPQAGPYAVVDQLLCSLCRDFSTALFFAGFPAVECNRLYAKMELFVKYRYTSPKWMSGRSNCAISQTSESKVCQEINFDQDIQQSDRSGGFHTAFSYWRI